MRSDGNKRRPSAWIGRLLVGLTRLVSRAFFRSVETEGEVPEQGAVVLAASHLYGFVDPVIVISRLGRMPRFLAKATLWDVPPAGVLLNAAGVIPVHRRVDGAASGDNDGMFSSAVKALANGQTVALFPEGTTHDEPTLKPLRTGAARIALEAAAAGVADVKLVPVGVTYEDKVRVRGRAVISYGVPIPVPAPPDAGDHHEAVVALTARLTSDLQALTPHFDTTEEALALAAAASISLTEGGEQPPMAAVAARARRLGRLAPERRKDLVDLVARYRMLLGFVGLDDDDVDEVERRDVIASQARSLAVLAIMWAVAAPLAAAGLAANLVPAILVLVAGLVVKAPVSKGTVRVLVAMFTFPVTWGLWAWADSRTGALGDLARRVTFPLDWRPGPDPGDRTGWIANLLVWFVVPAMGAVALVLVERARTFVMGLVRWRTLLDRRGQLVEVRARRAQVVAETRSALGDL